MLAEMTFLKYFVPIVDECRSRGIKSTMFVMRNGKYNCPYESKNMRHLVELSREHEFDVVGIDANSDAAGDVLITIEGSNRQRIKNKSKTVSITFSTDFTLSYKNYVNDVDAVVIGSEHSAKRYGTLSDKNLYLGSPKFDYTPDKRAIVKKYGLDSSKKCAVVFYPRLRDVSACPLNNITSYLKRLGFEVVCKTRGKDPILRDHYRLFDSHFDDVTWYPHTSLELIGVADVVVNFSSSVVEETTAYGVPMINYHVKPFPKPFDFLYDFDFVENADVNDTFDTFSRRMSNLLERDHTTQFVDAKKTIADSWSSSHDIIDEVLR